MGLLSKIFGGGKSKQSSGPTQFGMNQITSATSSTKDAFQPFLDFGRDFALPQLQEFMSDPSSITETPGYQFILQQGLEGLGRLQGAKGKFFSGETEKGIVDYASGSAASFFNDEFNRRFQLAGLGQQAASQYSSTLAGLAGSAIGTPYSQGKGAETGLVDVGFQFGGGGSKPTP